MGIEKLSTVTPRQKVYDEFHSTMYSLADSPMLMELIQRLLARVNPYLYIHAVKGKDLAPAVSHHQEMFYGFAEGDSGKAIAPLHQDLNGAAVVIMAHL